MTKTEDAQAETLYTVCYTCGTCGIKRGRWAGGLTLEEAADKMLCRGGGKWGVRRSRDKKLSGWQIWVSYRDTDGPWVRTAYMSRRENKTSAQRDMLEQVIKNGINGLLAMTDAEYEAGWREGIR